MYSFPTQIQLYTSLEAPWLYFQNNFQLYSQQSPVWLSFWIPLNIVYLPNIHIVSYLSPFLSVHISLCIQTVRCCQQSIPLTKDLLNKSREFDFHRICVQIKCCKWSTKQWKLQLALWTCYLLSLSVIVSFCHWWRWKRGHSNLVQCFSVSWPACKDL